MIQADNVATPLPACADCLLPYADDGFCDLIIPNEIFNSIVDGSIAGDGLLCPTCLCRRVRKAGYQDVIAKFRSGPFAELNSIRDSTIEDCARVAEQHSRLDVRCPCGFAVAEEIRALKDSTPREET